jgi:hypothetical protein
MQNEPMTARVIGPKMSTVIALNTVNTSNASARRDERWVPWSTSVHTPPAYGWGFVPLDALDIARLCHAVRGLCSS